MHLSPYSARTDFTMFVQRNKYLSVFGSQTNRILLNTWISHRTRLLLFEAYKLCSLNMISGPGVILLLSIIRISRDRRYFFEYQRRF